MKILSIELLIEVLSREYVLQSGECLVFLKIDLNKNNINILPLSKGHFVRNGPFSVSRLKCVSP